MCLLRQSNANTFISRAVTPVHPPTYLLTLSFQCRQSDKTIYFTILSFLFPFIGNKYYRSDLSDGFFFSCLFRWKNYALSLRLISFPNFYEKFKLFISHCLCGLCFLAALHAGDRLPIAPNSNSET